ncbi:MAG: MMPL family transporter, partial [Akkermansiaceae bacterium]|nr:MMPL family transporter [Verrucomicrobiales bacterium]
MIRFRPLLWFALAALIVLGLMRLRFDVEVLNLLPGELPAVHGLKLYQQHFANARELVITVRGTDAEQTETATRELAERLRLLTNEVASVTWQPPWLEHPEQSGELLAYLWFNQPPEIFRDLTNRFAPENIPSRLADAREELATSMSPAGIARLSYDPFGLTHLPESVSGAAPGFAQGGELFASTDGTFRIFFVKAASELNSYRDCRDWLQKIKNVEAAWRDSEKIPPTLIVNYTGRPAFVTEIAGGMERDITGSVAGTAFIIAVLFWLAHRRWKPMLWLLTLLALVLLSTLAFGGLIFGTINVVSMGFAAILLGLAVDYAVVHYQEALAHPNLSVPEIRGAIAPSIFWAAATTIMAFLVLNFGGLPGLAQLGSLVALGVTLAALVMIFAYLPPLFPERRKRRITPDVQAKPHPAADALSSVRIRAVALATFGMILGFTIVLLSGVPAMDSTANALRPSHSSAYTTLDEVKAQLGQKQEPLWIVISGRNETEVADRLAAVEPILQKAVSNHVLAGMTLPVALWPQPRNQQVNRETARALTAKRNALRQSVTNAGFSEAAFGLTSGMLDTWDQAANAPGVFWPTNDLSRWIFEKLVARNDTNLFAAGFLFPLTNAPAGNEAQLAALGNELNRDGVWLSGWQLLGHGILASVRSNLWKLLLPMIGLILASLWIAFRRWPEVLLSLAILFLSGLGLLTVMRFAGWSWNLLNLMALPLILGTGVDYSIFMQLALRRHGGNLRQTHRSVGRALFLCGGTAIAGFGSLAFSSNSGMASLGKVCAVGIAFNVLISVLLLPVWWRIATARKQGPGDGNPEPGNLDGQPGVTSKLAAPSSLYRTGFWRAGLWIVRILPRGLCIALGTFLATLYCAWSSERREIVIQNLMPALNGDRPAAARKARSLFREFAVTVIDLWQYEAGLPVDRLLG